MNTPGVNTSRRSMSNKVYISNKLAKIKDAEEAAKALEEEGKRQLLWGVKKDRQKSNKKPEKEEQEN